MHALGDVLHGPQFEKETHVHHSQDQQAERERIFIHFHSRDLNKRCPQDVFLHQTHPGHYGGGVPSVQTFHFYHSYHRDMSVNKRNTNLWTDYDVTMN